MPEPIQIKTIVRDGTRPGPHLLITGGVHGDEFEPMAAIRRLAAIIDQTQLAGRVTLAPCVNEAAFERQHRCAEDHLDLARVCPGSPDGSVTLRTADALSKLIREADYYIDLHTGGAVFSAWPLVGYTLHADPRVRRTQHEMARAFNLPLVWGTTPNLDGRSLSVARDANIPAIYAEYHGAGMMDPCGVEAYVQGCLNVMACLELIHRDPPVSCVAFDVQDEREQSGHLQVNHPSPTDGFFEPTVALGQAVAVGDGLGVIHDVLGQQPVTVTAQQAGVVVLLRTFCSVRKGEALGVIVEVNRLLGASAS